MALTLKEVEHIANLARLTLTAEEKEAYRRQLSDILSHAEQLQKIDTSHISPTASVLGQECRLREDTAGQSLTPQDLAKNAPAFQENQFKVPKVLE
ncbi:MAG: Asp-tRNA(Asn)/Glu-tRNA(Gln) amidotransferase subunit GatC [Anaerolineaceae bacterium]|nr:Asp-tRNA(Asn)/Glu-tRNA(Gln) amidotransferase subunit GatC [Anaerolineaceae bacterium]